MKEKKCESLGIECQSRDDENVTQSVIEKQIADFNTDDNINGILVQLHFSIKTLMHFYLRLILKRC